jgi:hypothetical protein
MGGVIEQSRTHGQCEIDRSSEGWSVGLGQLAGGQFMVLDIQSIRPFVFRSEPLCILLLFFSISLGTVTIPESCQRIRGCSVDLSPWWLTGLAQQVTP